MNPPSVDVIEDFALSEPADPTQELLEDLQDEMRWNELFKRTQAQLAVSARRAKQQIAAGMATPMDYNQL